jgi:hypothetical protein
MTPGEIDAALDRFYDLVDELRARCGGPRLLASCTSATGWPEHGVYFFFEPGEARRDGRDRVVRVGTHALTATSKTTLWKRLAQHRGNPGGARPGGGNHRGSIFRLHVGEALLARAGQTEGARITWGRGTSATAEVRAAEYAHEQAVSNYIGRMPFLWARVDDRAERVAIEAGAIALLSNRRHPLDAPSPSWLGRDAQRAAIRESGLWNVHHVDDAPTLGFLPSLAERVSAM